MLILIISKTQHLFTCFFVSVVEQYIGLVCLLIGWFNPRFAGLIGKLQLLCYIPRDPSYTVII